MASWKDAPVVGVGSEQGQPAWEHAPIEQPAAQQDAGGGIGAGRSLLRGINDGLTFGFADEISSAASAALNPILGTGNDGDTWRERYDLNVEGERALDRQAREQNPAASALAALLAVCCPWWPLAAPLCCRLLARLLLALCRALHRKLLQHQLRPA
jgi:hypothetical protein